MKTKILFSVVIIVISFASCTTTLQHRYVNDELYSDPVIRQEAHTQYDLDTRNDTLYQKYSDSNKNLYRYDPYGYYHFRWHHPHWYDWGYDPFYDPFYGYGYPWYRGWYHPWYTPSFFGYYGYYGYHRYYGYPYYSPYYSFSTVNRQRKSTANSIAPNGKNGSTSPHSQRIRSFQSPKGNNTLHNPTLRSSSNRKSNLPMRTIRAHDSRIRHLNSNPPTKAESRSKYIRPSIRKPDHNSIRKHYKSIVPSNKQSISRRPHIRQSRPTYSRPVRSARPAPPVRSSRPARSSSGRK